MNPFQQTYQQAVEKLFDPLTSEAGTPEEVIVEAEDRLGFHLPQTLREFYLLAGRRDDLNQSHDDLLNPEELTLEGDALIFYAENQGVVLWGIRVNDIGRNNPPVVVAVNEDVLEWGPDFEHLSDFLLWMLYRQAIEKYGSSSVRNGALLDAIRHGLSEVVRRMLDEGAEARTKNEGLIRAVIQNQSDIVKLLLHNNADAKARDEDTGKTALKYAEEYKASEDIVEALKAAGAVE